MSFTGEPESTRWADAGLAAALFSIDPVGTGGVALRALAGPVREQWLALTRRLLPPTTPLRRIPLHITDSRLLGGLDLAATLRAGRPVAERGVLVEADGGAVLLAMAERLTRATVARITAVLDAKAVVLERDGLALRKPAEFGVIALDEGMADDERPPAALLDRLAFYLDLGGIGTREIDDFSCTAAEVAAARACLPAVEAGNEYTEALCAVALALGIASARAPLLALRVACAAAALAGRGAVSEDDAAQAARLVLAPRATQLPASAPEDDAEQIEAEPDKPNADSSGADPQDNAGNSADLTPEDLVLAAAQAAIPAGLLAQLRLADAGRARSLVSGKAGVLRHGASRGRPSGVRCGEPRGGARLNIVETLRAAAPWQRLRRQQVARTGLDDPLATRIQVRRDDFRVTRFKHRTETTTIFVVDASGSSAFNRLAEAKGAIELLLADCYVRRDRVALIAFRGHGAELLLPPTRSLVRARRSLASLPGGGGTPLASGIDAALALTEVVTRRGETPVLILLTDGRANIARDGSAGRPRAGEETLAAARQVRAAGIGALLVDTSPRPQPLAGRLAAEMGGTYLPLPYADATALSRAARATALTQRQRPPAA